MQTPTLSKKAIEAIALIDLIKEFRKGIDFKERNPSEISEAYNQSKIKELQERINDLFATLRFAGYEVEYRDTTTTVLKDGQKWLEKTDWTEFPRE